MNTPSTGCMNGLRRAIRAAVFAAFLAESASAQTGGTFDLSWWTIDCGGGTSTGGTLVFDVTFGQPDAGQMTGGAFSVSGGYWAGPAAVSCYANCDGSTTTPLLNVNDFVCFLNKFAASDAYANCDHSTTPPVLNVLDFTCFLNAFAAGCA